MITTFRISHGLAFFLVSLNLYLSLFIDTSEAHAVYSSERRSKTQHVLIEPSALAFIAHGIYLDVLPVNMRCSRDIEQEG